MVGAAGFPICTMYNVHPSCILSLSTIRPPQRDFHNHLERLTFFLFLLGGTVHTRMIKIQMKIIAYLCAFCSENSSIFSIGMSAP